MRWLTPEEKGKIEAWLDSGAIPTGKYSQFYRLFMAIALETGLRLTEIIGGDSTVHGSIVGLMHWQANTENESWDQVLRLKRKDAAKLRTYMGPRTVHIYLEMFEGTRPPPEGRVFEGGPNTKYVQKFCTRLGKRLGIPNLSPHRLRHTVGKDIMRRTGDVSLVQKALGHKHMSTAMIYSEASEEEGFQAIRAVRKVS